MADQLPTKSDARVAVKTKGNPLVDWLYLVGLAFVCVVVGAAVFTWLGFGPRLRFWILAAGLQVAAALPFSWEYSLQSSGKSQVVRYFLLSGFRMLVVAVAAFVATATKSSDNNLFVTCLLGCYFPFLILESWLSMRRISRSR